jgi:hypothetical protein
LAAWFKEAAARNAVISATLLKERLYVATRLGSAASTYYLKLQDAT